MRLADVERVLGPGKALSADKVPLTNDSNEPDATKRVHPVVKGAQVVEWTGGEFQIVVGFDNGIVCDKWIWSPGF
jgi:hypothetical protein